MSGKDLQVNTTIFRFYFTLGVFLRIVNGLIFVYWVEGEKWGTGCQSPVPLSTGTDTYVNLPEVFTPNVWFLPVSTSFDPRDVLSKYL